MVQKKKRNKSTIKGITLISLVITIIVLLILAGISINMLSGDNSILNRATETKNTEQEKNIAEKVRLAYLGAITRTKGQTSEEAFEETLNNELSKEFSNYTLELNNKRVIIDGKKYGFDGTVKKAGTVLTEEQKTIAIGQFIKWNVPYTDVYYTSYSYDQNTGWRILKIEEGEKVGKYNIEIISTGIPAMLYYYFNQNPTNTNNANNKWWGTDTTMVKNYYSEIGTNNFKNSNSWSYNYSGYYAAYGLKNNFSKITFIKGLPEAGVASSNYNLAAYDTINGKQGPLDTEAKVKEAFSDIMLEGKIAGIREVEARDIKEDLGIALPASPGTINSTSGLNDKAIGLFKLNEISEILQGKEYNDTRYLLATPPCSNNYEYAAFLIDNRNF